MAMLSSNYEQTACIPARIVKERVTCFYGGKMPELDDGAVWRRTG